MIGNLEQGGTGQFCLPRTESDDCPHFSQQSAGKKKKECYQDWQRRSCCQAWAQPKSVCFSRVKNRLLRARSASPACRGLKWIPESSSWGWEQTHHSSRASTVKASRKGTSESWINLEVEVEICRMKWELQGYNTAHRCDMAFLWGQYKTKGLQIILKLEVMSCSERSEVFHLFSLSQEDWESTWLIYKHPQGKKTQDPAALFNQAEKCIRAAFWKLNPNKLKLEITHRFLIGGMTDCWNSLSWHVMDPLSLKCLCHNWIPYGRKAHAKYPLSAPPSA